VSDCLTPPLRRYGDRVSDDKPEPMYASDMSTEDFIAASRKLARSYARKATEGIKDRKPDLYVHSNAVMANLYYAAALDADHFGNLPEV